MAWRFHPSKFKNTSPKTPKKEDTIFDVPVGTLSSGNNGIQCSTSLIAFNLDGEGGKLGVLPIDARGRRQRKDMTILCAHFEPLTDFTFLPFEPNVLATCCRDDQLKIWRVENALECESIGEATSKMRVGSGQCLECLSAHTVAANIVAAAYDCHVGVVDIQQQLTAIEVKVSFDEHINSIGWSFDGKLLGVLGDKGRHGAVVDPRSNQLVVDSLQVHSGIGRECRIVFAGNEKIITSGFTTQRTQEVRVYDIRNWQSAEHSQEFSPSTGVLIPLYDVDTKLLFLAGKGTNKLNITELQSKAPIISPVYEYIMHDQNVGACLGSKLRLDVMSGEVARFYQLSKNTISPVPCIVPRRSYRDFHADLFPETVGPFSGCSANEWLDGSNLQPMRVSLDPARKGELIATINIDSKSDAMKSDSRMDQQSQKESLQPKTAGDQIIINGNRTAESTQHSNISERSSNVNINVTSSNDITEQVMPKPSKRAQPHNEQNHPPVKSVNQPPSRTESMSRPPATTASTESKPQTTSVASEPAVRLRSAADSSSHGGASGRSRVSRVMSIVGITSKYRHVETIPGGNHGTFTNVRSVNTRLPTECNSFCVSCNYAAIPLSGSAGIVNIVSLSNVHKLPDGVIDGIQNHTLLTDFVWNPFDETRLACALDNGIVNIWTIEFDANDEKKCLAELQPSAVYKVSHEKIISIRYNPCALDVMAIASQDHCLSIWNLESNKCEWLVRMDQPALSIAWSSDGRRLAAVGRDLFLCVYEPKRGNNEEALLNRKKLLESPRAARILFVCNDAMIVIVHFARSSNRVITLVDSSTLEVKHTHQFDTSPQPLIPHYDFDSSVLFLTSKGDRFINMFEVIPTDPYLLPMASASFPNGHQAISLHPKIVCDVKAVEFQRGWRLTEKSMERISFRVPRVKKDLFQSDIFPRALATWIPVMSASDWFDGNYQPRLFVDLCPEDMQPYIASPQPAVRRSILQPQPRSQSHPQQQSISDGNAKSPTAPNGFASTVPQTPSNIGECRAEALRGAVDPNERKIVEMSWSNRIGVDLTLEQDRMQGVDEEEWYEDL